MEMRSRLTLSSRLLEDETSPSEIVELLGNGVRTLDSVPTALYTAMKYSGDPEKALIQAVGYGGDTDTIAAMVGAVVGAMHGAGSFPQRWHNGLERGKDGYEELSRVSRQLAKMID
jgi:poly(ADP-ribose) glycohydrolase ARH3